METNVKKDGYSKLRQSVEQYEKKKHLAKLQAI